FISELPPDPAPRSRHLSAPLLPTAAPPLPPSTARISSPLTRLTNSAAQLRIDTHAAPPQQQEVTPISPSSANRRHILSWTTYEGGPRREDSLRRSGHLSANMSPSEMSQLWGGGGQDF